MALQVIIGLLIRHALTALGGGVFATALLTGDAVDQIAGGVAAVVGVALSAIDKRK